MILGKVLKNGLIVGSLLAMVLGLNMAMATATVVPTYNEGEQPVMGATKWTCDYDDVGGTRLAEICFTDSVAGIKKGDYITARASFHNLMSTRTWRVAVLVEDPNQLDPVVPNTPKTLYYSGFRSVRVSAGASRNLILRIGTSKLTVSGSRTVRAKILMMRGNLPVAEIWEDITVTE